MEELIKKLKDAGKLESINSEEELRATAKELGYSDEDVDRLISEIPLDDDALEQATGGLAFDRFKNWEKDIKATRGTAADKFTNWKKVVKDIYLA